MKNILKIFFVFISLHSLAQIPTFVSHQTVVRNSQGNILPFTTVNFKFSIHQNTNNGTLVYEETQSITTNKDALATLKIGTGVATVGNFSLINWSTGLYFLRVKIDVTGGTSFVLSSMSQFSTVPYTFFAKEAASIDYANLKNAPNVDSTLISASQLKNKNIENIHVADSFSVAHQKHFVGEHYLGGIIFYVDQTGEHGLLSFENSVTGTSIMVNEAWSSTNFLTNANDDGFGSGKTNTNNILIIIGQDPKSIFFPSTDALQFNLPGYVPSLSELKLALMSKSVIGLSDGIYWSSNEFDLRLAKGISVANGVLTEVVKSKKERHLTLIISNF